MSEEKKQPKTESEAASKDRPISKTYPVIDTDLARDNVENDLSAADWQDV